jgi:hypothetical protein
MSAYRAAVSGLFAPADCLLKPIDLCMTEDADCVAWAVEDLDEVRVSQVDINVKMPENNMIFSCFPQHHCLPDQELWCLLSYGIVDVLSGEGNWTGIFGNGDTAGHLIRLHDFIRSAGTADVCTGRYSITIAVVQPSPQPHLNEMPF